jgi:hypothetical protein
MEEGEEAGEEEEEELDEDDDSFEDIKARGMKIILNNSAAPFKSSVVDLEMILSGPKLGPGILYF